MLFGGSFDFSDCVPVRHVCKKVVSFGNVGKRISQDPF